MSPVQGTRTRRGIYGSSATAELLLPHAFCASYAAISIMLTQFKVNTDTQTICYAPSVFVEYMIQGTNSPRSPTVKDNLSGFH